MPLSSSSQSENNSNLVLIPKIKCNRPSKEIEKCLSENPILSNERDSCGNTPLFYLQNLASNKLRIVGDMLIESGADVNACNNIGLTAIQQSESFAVANYLQLVPDINITSDTFNAIVDEDGRTVLERAIIEYPCSFVEFLLKNGANSNVESKDGVPLIILALNSKNLGVIKLMEKKGAEATPDMINTLDLRPSSAADKDAKFMQYLIKKNIDAKKNHSFTKYILDVYVSVYSNDNMRFKESRCNQTCIVN